WTEPSAPFSSGDPLTITLYVKVANSGHSAAEVPATVRVYGDEALIGERLVPALGGCATSAVISVTWSQVMSGVHQVRVEVDPGNHIAESNESDNVLSTPILIASSRVWLPTILKSAP
ncbi:MAG: CARDB domain-containing protein, partial [Anaerolineae bacterium]